MPHIFSDGCVGVKTKELLLLPSFVPQSKALVREITELMSRIHHAFGTARRRAIILAVRSLMREVVCVALSLARYSLPFKVTRILTNSQTPFSHLSHLLVMTEEHDERAGGWRPERPGTR